MNDYVIHELKMNYNKAADLHVIIGIATCPNSAVIPVLFSEGVSRSFWCLKNEA